MQPLIPEFGQLALILALVAAVLQFLVPVTGLRLRQDWLMAYARPLANAQAVFLLLSLLALTYAFVVDDFFRGLCGQQQQYCAAHAL